MWWVLPSVLFLATSAVAQTPYDIKRVQWIDSEFDAAFFEEKCGTTVPENLTLMTMRYGIATLIEPEYAYLGEQFHEVFVMDYAGPEAVTVDDVSWRLAVVKVASRKWESAAKDYVPIYYYHCREMEIDRERWSVLNGRK